MNHDQFHQWATPTLLQSSLKGYSLGQHLFTFVTIDSTNSWLKTLAETDRNLDTGTLVLSDFQTRGRGRQNRQWVAAPGTALMGSLFLRLGWQPEQAHWITMMAGVAMAMAIEETTEVAVALKWPNDIIIKDDVYGYRKLGGILTDANWVDGELAWVVLGVGVNVNMPAFSLPPLPPTTPPATSLLLQAKHPISRLALLQKYLHHLHGWLEKAKQGISPRRAWLARLVWMGQTVRVIAEESEIVGVAEGVDKWGRLLIRDMDGTHHTINAGDVSLRINPKH